MSKKKAADEDGQQGPITDAEVILATEVGELVGAVLRIIPDATEEKVKAFMEIIHENATKAGTGDGAVKEITENVVDTLEAIGEVLPPTTEPKAARSQRAYKNAVKLIKGFVGLFGLQR